MKPFSAVTKRYIKVCGCGFVGMLVQFAVFNALRHLLHPEWANVIAIELAIISNYLLNHHVSFKDRRLNDNWRIFINKLIKFNILSCSSLLIQVVVMHLGIRFIGRTGLEMNLYVIVGIGLGSIANFFFYNKVIWR